MHLNANAFAFDPMSARYTLGEIYEKLVSKLSKNMWRDMEMRALMLLSILSDDV